MCKQCVETSTALDSPYGWLTHLLGGPAILVRPGRGVSWEAGLWVLKPRQSRANYDSWLPYSQPQISTFLKLKAFI